MSILIRIQTLTSCGLVILNSYQIELFIPLEVFEKGDH